MRVLKLVLLELLEIMETVVQYCDNIVCVSCTAEANNAGIVYYHGDWFIEEYPLNKTDLELLLWVLSIFAPTHKVVGKCCAYHRLRSNIVLESDSHTFVAFGHEFWSGSHHVIKLSA